MNNVSTDDFLLINDLLFYLVKEARENEELEVGSPGFMLGSLINGVYKKYGKKEKVAILIDEYDAPIVRFIDNPEKEKIAREKLSDFYNILKTRANMIGHIFITGVSRYAKASIFSMLNQLMDLTLSDKYSAIYGFTQDDVDELLRLGQDNALKELILAKTMPESSTRDDLRCALKAWYYGYSRDGKTRVYNPLDILLFFKKAKFDSCCYKSGDSTFLQQLSNTDKSIFELANKTPIISSDDNVKGDLENIKPEILLFQTGYLTIKEIIPKNFRQFTIQIRYPQYRASKGNRATFT